MNIKVREITASDIDLIANYWLTSDHNYLESLGVDIAKLPLREDLINMLKSQISTPKKEKLNYALIWEIDHQIIGHSNINDIIFGTSANMHLHIWTKAFRRKGAGLLLLKESIQIYFKEFDLEVLNCSPYAKNRAPNKALDKLGFTLIKKHITIPGSLNFEQEVMHWQIKKNEIESLTKKC